MNERFALAGKGLWYLFLSVILALAGAVVAIVPIIGWIACPILIIAGLVLQVVGFYTARTAHPNLQNAFYIALIGLGLGAISAFVPEEGMLAGLVSIASDVLGFAVTYFVCAAAGELLAEKGDTEQAARAELIWKLYGGCTVVSVLCTLTGWVPILGVIMGAAGVVSAVVGIVAGVLEIIFYYQASNSLRS